MFVLSTAFLIGGAFLFPPSTSSVVPRHDLHKRAARPLDQLFTVQTDGEGACSPSDVSDLRLWLTESDTLITTALDAIEVYRSNAHVRESIATWLGTKPLKNGITARYPQQLTDIEGGYCTCDPFSQPNGLANKTPVDWYQTVADFMSGGILGDNTDKTPMLLCDSKWLHFVDIANDDAHAADTGELYLADKDGEEVPLKFNEVPELMEYLDPPENEADPFVRVPYWAPILKEYCVSKDWGAAFNHDYCSVLNEDGELENNAGTDTMTNPATMLICPVAFGRGSAKLGDVTAQTDTELGKVQSRSVTMVHELFHLAKGGDNSKDYCSKLLHPQSHERARVFLN